MSENAPEKRGSHPPTVEACCAAFEVQCQSKTDVSIERFLQELPVGVGDEGNLTLRLIHQEMEHRRRKGETPRIDEYASRFPDVDRASLRDLFLLPAPPPVDVVNDPLPPRYQLIEEIGKGGIGSVWRVLDKTLERPLAAKMLHEKYRSDSGANARLDREALLTGALQHPGVPPIHDRGKLLTGSSFFTMKLVDGKTLDHLLQMRSQVDQDRTHWLNIFEQIAQTVAYAHSKCIIHRDLKPQNIMVGQFGEVQIMDWGMAKRLATTAAANDMPNDTSTDSIPFRETEKAAKDTLSNSHDSSFADPLRTLTRHGDVFGTPAYMPPEQATGDLDAMDERSDVFGLGAVLFEILTDKRLYDDVPTANLISAAASGALENSLKTLDRSDVDLELKQLCRDCLAVAPQERPANGQIVADRTASYLASVDRRLKQAEISRKQAEVKVAEERKRRRLTTLLAATILTAVAVGIMATVWYQFDQAKQAERSNQERTQTLVETVGAAPVDGLPYAIENLRPLQSLSLAQLQREFESTDDQRQKLRFAVAMAHLGDVRADYLTAQVAAVPPEEFNMLTEALSLDAASVLPRVTEEFEAETDLHRKSDYALIALNLGDSKNLIEFLADPRKVEQRVAFFESCEKWHGDPSKLIEIIDLDCGPAVRYSILAGIAEIPAERIDASERKRLAESIRSTCQSANHAGVRAAAELLLVRWGQTLPENKPAAQPAENRNWYANSVGMIMIRAKRPDYDGDTRFAFDGGYEFYLSDREVTVAQFRKFLDEDKQTAERLAGAASGAYEGTSYRRYIELKIGPDADDAKDSITPMTNLGYYDTLRFCNWLSRREGLEPYYIDRSSEEIKNSIGGIDRKENWIQNRRANGYRLPEPREFSQALMGSRRKPDSDTFYALPPKHYFRYAWFLRNTFSLQPGARKLPNRHGFFDLWGNLKEFSDFRESEQSDKKTYFNELGGSYRIDDLKNSNFIGQPFGTIVLTETSGFRVARCDKVNLDRRLQEQLISKLDRIRVHWQNAAPLIKFKYMRNLTDHGIQFADLKRHKLALDSYRLSKQIASHLIEQSFRETECLLIRGGNSVNSAIELLALRIIDGVQEQLDAAEADLKSVLEKDKNHRTAKVFLRNRGRVQARLWLAEASVKASHPDGSQRDGEEAVALAEKAIKVLGAKRSSTLAIRARGVRASRTI